MNNLQSNLNVLQLNWIWFSREEEKEEKVQRVTLGSDQLQYILQYNPKESPASKLLNQLRLFPNHPIWSNLVWDFYGDDSLVHQLANGSSSLKVQKAFALSPKKFQSSFASNLALFKKQGTENWRRRWTNDFFWDSAAADHPTRTKTRKTRRTRITYRYRN